MTKDQYLAVEITQDVELVEDCVGCPHFKHMKKNEHCYRYFEDKQECQQQTFQDAETSEFDSELDDAECFICHEGVSLEDGLEWPRTQEEIMCHTCEIKQLKTKLEAETKRAEKAEAKLKAGAGVYWTKVYSNRIIELEAKLKEQAEEIKRQKVIKGAAQNLVDNKFRPSSNPYAYKVHWERLEQSLKALPDTA